MSDQEGDGFEPSVPRKRNNFFVELDAGEDAEERVDQEQDDKPAEGQVMPRYRPAAMVWRDGVAQPGSIVARGPRRPTV
jgi:hypothetical protein